jgi:hypothetical protein
LHIVHGSACAFYRPRGAIYRIFQPPSRTLATVHVVAPISANPDPDAGFFANRPEIGLSQDHTINMAQNLSPPVASGLPFPE